MAGNIKNKEIQVQKPAQSLQAFQKKVASGEDLQTGILKPILVGSGILLALILSIVLISVHRSRTIDRHEAALATLLLEVQGDPANPPSPAEQEQRMRERLSRLEALAKAAPSSRRATTEGVLNDWKLQLDGKGTAALRLTDAWARLRYAQRCIELGQGPEAQTTLAPLRKDAGPDAPWANLYWSTLLDARRLQGDREQAWKDFAEYKARFRDQADTAAMEHILAGI